MKKLILFLNDISSETIKMRIGESSPVIAEADTCKLVLFSDEAEDSSSESENGNEKTYYSDIAFNDVLSLIEKDIEQGNLRTVVVLPPFVSSSTQVKVPAKQFKKISKALPYLVEDQTASEAETLFIASGAYQNEKLHCCIIDRSIIKTYRDFFINKGLNCDTLLCASDLIKKQAPSLHVFSEYILMSSPKGEDYALSMDLLETYLNKFVTQEAVMEIPELLEDSITSADIKDDAFEKSVLPVFIYEDNADTAQVLQTSITNQVNNFSKQNEFNYKLDFKSQSVEQFFITQASSLVYRYERQGLINMLQGEFKIRRVAKRININFNWKPPAILLGVFILISLLSLYIDGYRYEKAALKAEQQSKALFNEIFPGTQNYTRMQSRVAALLKGDSGGQGSEFIKLMVLFSESLALVNETSPEAITATRFQYEQNTDRLRVDALAISFDKLNTLKELAKSKGLMIDIASTNSEDNGVKTRLEVSLQ